MVDVPGFGVQWRLSPSEIERAGAHYTPIDLVDLTLSQVLPDLLRERLTGVDDPLAVLNTISIVDPAVGTGAFTTRVAQILFRFADLIQAGVTVDDAISQCWDDDGRCLVDKTDLMPWDKMGECLRWVLDNLITSNKDDLEARIGKVFLQTKKKPDRKAIRQHIEDTHFEAIHLGNLSDTDIDAMVAEEMAARQKIEPGEYGNQYVKVSSLIIAHVERLSDSPDIPYRGYLNSAGVPVELLPLEYPGYLPTGMVVGANLVAFWDQAEQVWGETDRTSRVLISFPLPGRQHLNIDRRLVAI